MATLFCLQKNVCVKDRMKGMWLKSRKQKNGFLSLRYVSAFQRYQESIKYISIRENAQVNYHHWKNATSLSLLIYANFQQKRHKENVDAELSFALAKNLPLPRRT